MFVYFILETSSLVIKSPVLFRLIAKFSSCTYNIVPHMSNLISKITVKENEHYYFTWSIFGVVHLLDWYTEYLALGECMSFDYGSEWVEMPPTRD